METGTPRSAVGAANHVSSANGSPAVDAAAAATKKLGLMVIRYLVEKMKRDGCAGLALMLPRRQVKKLAVSVRDLKSTLRKAVGAGKTNEAAKEWGFPRDAIFADLTDSNENEPSQPEKRAV